jgi:hypothetical protein
MSSTPTPLSQARSPAPAVLFAIALGIAAFKVRAAPELSDGQWILFRVVISMLAAALVVSVPIALGKQLPRLAQVGAALGVFAILVALNPVRMIRPMARIFVNDYVPAAQPSPPVVEPAGASRETTATAPKPTGRSAGPTKFAGTTTSPGVSGLTLGTEPQVTTVVGGNGGAHFQLDCPPNHVVVGVRGLGGNPGDHRVFQIGPMCAMLSLYDSGSFYRIAAERADTAAMTGSVSGLPFRAQCRNGTAVGAVSTQAFVSGGSPFANVVNVRCWELTSDRAGQTSAVLTESIAVHAPANLDIVSSECRPGSIATGLTGRSGMWLDAVGLVCRALVTYPRR